MTSAYTSKYKQSMYSKLDWTGGDAQHKQKKSLNWSRDDTTDILYSEKLCF